MPATLSKVIPGDPLAIPAAAYNAFVDAARANQADNNALLQVPQSAFQQSGIILVRNDSGADRDRFDVLGIDEPVFDPADDEDAFKNRVVLAGVTPTTADHAGRSVVLLEPVADGEVGRACIAGVCPAWVNFQAADDGFADVYDGDATQLKGCASGAAQVLWKQEGTGPLWAVVRLGPDPKAIRWGVIFDYPPDPNQTVNSISVHPCEDAQGGGVDESKALTLFVASPVSVSPTAAAPNFHDGDVVAYLPFPAPETGPGGTADGIVVSPDLSPIFAGHDLLDGDLHGDTDLHTPPNGGDIIYADGPLWKALPIGAAGTVLKVANGLPAWGQGAAGANALLDGVNHSDTNAAAPVAGDIIYATAGGKWDALATGGAESILTVSAAGLPAWFAIGANDLVLKVVNGALAWAAETVPTNALLDGASHSDTNAAAAAAGSIVYGTAGAKWDALAAGAAYSILTVSAGGLPAWLPKGANNTVLKTVNGALVWGAGQNQPNALLDGANHNDTVAAVPVAGSMIYAHGGAWDALGAGGAESILRITQAGLPAWFGVGAAQSLLYSDANATLAWLAKGNSQSILTVDANGALAWFAPSVDVNKSLAIDSNGHLAWRTFSLLDNSHHHDCTSQGNPPGHGSIIAGGDVLAGGQAWQEVAAPAKDGCPLVSASAETAGVKWLDGATLTFNVVTDVRQGLVLQKKTRQLTVVEGVITAIGNESGWT